MNTEYYNSLDKAYIELQNYGLEVNEYMKTHNTIPIQEHVKLLDYLIEFVQVHKGR